MMQNVEIYSSIDEAQLSRFIASDLLHCSNRYKIHFLLVGVLFKSNRHGIVVGAIYKSKITIAFFVAMLHVI